jgi:hypothetical protein
VSILIVSHLFGFVFDFSSSEELLGSCGIIQNHSKTRSHVDYLALRVIVDVLSGVLASVAINELQLKSCIRLGVVYRRVVIGLLNSSNPRLNCHEFLDLFIRNLFCKYKAVSSRLILSRF